jgi:biotin synthase
MTTTDAVDASTKVALRPRVKLVPTDLTEPARTAIETARHALLNERRELKSDELAALVDAGVAATAVLAELAHDVRLAYAGATVEIEGIVSAKTGGCPEDCHFCSQSSKFPTDVKATPFLDDETLLRAAEETKATGATEFCIVLAVRGPDERTMSRLLDLVPRLAEATGLQIAVSAGILTSDQAAAFARVGVHRYNHNLETSRSYFPSVVTTHTYDERLETCRLVQENKMELCCGVLLGMGESDERRSSCSRPYESCGRARYR